MNGKENSSALCLDIGSGTQDVFYFMKDREIENCPKFVLPSPAVQVAEEIRNRTDRGRPVYLHGTNMGGGFAHAVREHLQQGVAAAIHPQAAFALGDDPGRVESMGLEILDACPPGYSPIACHDFDPGFWSAFLGSISLPYPDMVLAAAQDHGFHPKASNRKGRFRIWTRFLQEQGGRVEKLLYLSPPGEMTRLAALQASIGGGAVADTGAAAVLGALFVPEVEARSRRQGICIVNVGNSHTIAFLLFKGRILGVFEHHTGLLDAESLKGFLERFRAGDLSNDEVFQKNGHGCSLKDIPGEAGGFDRTYILGPRRGMLEGVGELLAPGGDMMLAGCFGLLKGACMRGIL